MSAAESVTLVSVFLAPGVGLVCYHVGRRVGRDEGWLEHYFETEAEKRAKRDALGRFRTLPKADFGIQGSREDFE